MYIYIYGGLSWPSWHLADVISKAGFEARATFQRPKIGVLLFLAKYDIFFRPKKIEIYLY